METVSLLSLLVTILALVCVLLLVRLGKTKRALKKYQPIVDIKAEVNLRNREVQQLNKAKTHLLMQKRNIKKK